MPWPTRSATPRGGSARTSPSGTRSGRGWPRSPRPRLKAWKKAVKDAVDAGEPPPDKPDDAEVPPGPKRPRLVTTDATMEAAALLAQQEPKGLMLVRDELAGWVGGLDKYGGDGAERAFWIEAYGGRFKVVDRVKFDGQGAGRPAPQHRHPGRHPAGPARQHGHGRRR